MEVVLGHEYLKASFYLLSEYAPGLTNVLIFVAVTGNAGRLTRVA
jgi:hypothetical protein